MSEKDSPLPATTTDRQALGTLFIVSAPSGAGKTTLCRILLGRFPKIVYSVSHTTRSPRQGEKNGTDYYFISRDEFRRGIKTGMWAEWAKVHDNYYGTSAGLLHRTLAAGKDMLLDIDVQGMRQIVERFPESVTIFIAPPSLETLRKRLEKRGAEGPAEIAKRMANAEKEMARMGLYRYVILNDRLDDAAAALTGIVRRHSKDADGGEL